MCWQTYLTRKVVDFQKYRKSFFQSVMLMKKAPPHNITYIYAHTFIAEGWAKLPWMLYEITEMPTLTGSRRRLERSKFDSFEVNLWLVLKWIYEFAWRVVQCPANPSFTLERKVKKWQINWLNFHCLWSDIELTELN